jgi:hypothetical protein
VGYRGHVEGGTGELMVSMNEEAVGGVFGDLGLGEEVTVGVAGGQGAGGVAGAVGDRDTEAMRDISDELGTRETEASEDGVGCEKGRGAKVGVGEDEGAIEGGEAGEDDVLVVWRIYNFISSGGWWATTGELDHNVVSTTRKGV